MSELTVTYESELANQFLSYEAKKALSKTVKTTLMQDQNGNVTGMAVYLTAQYKLENKAFAVEKIALDLNRLAKAGLILGSLTEQVSSIKMARLPLSAQTYVVFMYPIVDANRMDEVRAMCECWTEYGGVGLQVGSVKPDAEPDGTVLVGTHVSYAAMMIQTAEAYLDEEIGRMLGALPKNTKFISAEQTAVFDLSAPYELKFSNPLFQGLREIRFNYVRDLAQTDSGVVQGDMLVSIDYIKNDGTKKYQT